jgi:hypothetical protein
MPLASFSSLVSIRAVGIHGKHLAELPDPTFTMLNAFRHGLHELGYTEGQNLAIERGGGGLGDGGETGKNWRPWAHGEPR